MRCAMPAPMARIAPACACGIAVGVASKAMEIWPATRSDIIGAEVTARAGFVLHQELLPQNVGELRADYARDGVGRPAGGEGNDDADRPRGIGVIGVRGDRTMRERRHKSENLNKRRSSSAGG